MTARVIILILLSCVPTLTARQTSQTAAEEFEAGVVVETVASGSASARADLRPNDRITTWIVAGEDVGRSFADLSTPYDLAYVQIERLPRAAIVFAGLREGVSTTWTMPSGVPGLGFRPTLPSSILALYRSARERERERAFADAASRLREAAHAAEPISPTTAVWLLALAGTILSDNMQFAQADEFMAESRKVAVGLNRPALMALLHRQSGRSLRARSQWTRAIEHFTLALEFDRQGSDENLACALDYLSLAEIDLLRGDLAAAEPHYQRALAIRESLAPNSVEVADVLNGGLGNIAAQRGDFAGATTYMKRALAIAERTAPDSLYMAAVVHNIGVMARNLGDLDDAETWYRRALAIREKVAPDSLHVAHSFNSLAALAGFRGQLEEAEALHRRALVIRERDAPDSGPVSDSLTNLSEILRMRGDLNGAEEVLRRALIITTRQAPNSLGLATTLNNLGAVLQDRGRLDEAEDLYLQSLAIRLKVAPTSQHVAESYTNLGGVASERRDFAVADDYLLRALKIKEAVAPRATATAVTLHNLGNSAMLRADSRAAEAYLRRALVILDDTAPNSVERLAVLNLLATVVGNRGDAAGARAIATRALELGERIAPAGLGTAQTLHQLARAAFAQKHLAEAEIYVQRSLEITHSVAPESGLEAAVLYLLGQIQARSGQPERALSTYRRAVDAFEQQASRVGGADDVQAGYGATGKEYYEAAVNTALALRRIGDAFDLQERSRARSFLSKLAERDLMFKADIPADVAREQRLIDADYDRTVTALSSLKPDKQAESAKHRMRLRELRDRREALVTRVRQLSPRFAALKYPQPLQLDEIRSVLDPGTLLLTYWVGRTTTRLFVVHPAGEGRSTQDVAVFTLPVGATRLRGLVGDLNAQMRGRRPTSAGPRAVGRVTADPTTPLSTLHRASSEVYDLLMRPAAQHIAQSRRLLIVPDGPLHGLPFAALRVPAAGTVPARYLVEWKPLHTIVSATVYGQARRERMNVSAGTPVRLVAFGDPAYPPIVDTSSASAARADRGVTPARLPATRKEVAAIAKLFPSAAVVFLGADATEERAKDIGHDVRYIHFASHAVLDEQLPLNSALLLTMPTQSGIERDNGLLQVWEVFEYMRIDADLVTLSACETGIGAEFHGEGMIGLTRAFQYAGARSVLASLWSVADDSTAELMSRFYGYLRQGRSKDQALRAAQLDAIRSQSPFTHPFHWAAFSLFGDWQ